MSTPRTLTPVLALALALSGCGGGLSYYEPGAGDGGTTATTDGGGPVAGDDDDDNGGTSGIALAVDEVSPTFGPNGGGTEVVVLGRFDDDTEILFDGEAARVVDRGDDRMVVEAPSTNTEGWVDVQAVSGDRDATLDDGFQYWADGQGLSGMVGDVGYVDMVGGYWLDDTDLKYATIAFTEPLDWELWRDYTNNLGNCQFEYTSSFTPVFYDPGATVLELDGGVATARLQSQGNGVYSDGPNANVVPGQVYDLAPINGAADWPVEDIPNVVEVPDSFNVTAPNLDRNEPPNTARAIDLAWSGNGGDFVLIYLLRQRPSGQNWIDDGYVTCAVPDTGSFTVPSNTWPNWSNGDLIHIQVGRAIERRVELPHNGAETRASGVYWVYGAALAN